MCIGVHDIVSFGDQSAKAEESRHLILVTKTNIWCATVMAKWITSILTITHLQSTNMKAAKCRDTKGNLQPTIHVYEKD